MKSLNEHISIIENKKSEIHVYHGTNSEFDTISLDNSASSQGKVLWTVDEYSYAATQGKYVKEFVLRPNKILNKETINSLTDEEIKAALVEFTPTLSDKKLDRIMIRVRKNIDKYNKGTLSGMDIFNGMGDTSILLSLNFDMESFPNPYDKSKESNFHVVFNTKIVTNK